VMTEVGVDSTFTLHLPIAQEEDRKIPLQERPFVQL